MTKLYNQTITNSYLWTFTYDELEELYFDYEEMYNIEDARRILLHLGKRLGEYNLNDSPRCPWVRVVILYDRLVTLGLESDAECVLSHLVDTLGDAEPDKMENALQEIEWFRN